MQQKPPVIVPLTVTHVDEYGKTMKYTRHEQLGKGGFAVVYRVVDQYGDQQ